MKINPLIIFLISVFEFTYSQITFPSQPGLTVIQKKQPETIKPDSLIFWSVKPLSWNNYTVYDTIVKRKVGTVNITGKAGTTTTINDFFKCNGDTFYYNVRNIMSVKRSWVLKEAKNDSALLRHEQIHFDITELYARKIRKLLAEYINPCGKEKEIKAAINVLKQEQINENNLYDIESVHSTNKIMQKKWDEKIKKELKETEMYINPKGKRHIK